MLFQGHKRLNWILPAILLVAVLGAVVAFIYMINEEPRETFTEFYILNSAGKASDYPSDLEVGSSTEVTLGIVNREQQQTTYSVSIQIDGQPVNIVYNGQNVSRLNAITLEQGEKWEGDIGFAPMHTGENQKVKFLLYNDGSAEAHNSLHLWINAVIE